MTDRIIIAKEDLTDLLKAIGLEYEETRKDFQICIPDGNDSVYFLEFIEFA